MESPLLEYPALPVTLALTVGSGLPGLPAIMAGDAFSPPSLLGATFRFPQDSVITGVHLNSQIFGFETQTLAVHVGLLQQGTPRFAISLTSRLWVSHTAVAPTGSGVFVRENADTFEHFDARTGIIARSGERAAIFITYSSLISAWEINALAQVFYVPTAAENLKG